jgi:hypothetical protein
VKFALRFSPELPGGFEDGVVFRPEVRDAYRELEQRHTRGKIVLKP